MSHIQDQNLLPGISALLKTAGLVNEEQNGLLLFLLLLTRDFDQPLQVLIHGSSVPQKMNFWRTVLSCIPDENLFTAPGLTETLLFHPPYKDFWKYKILLLEELENPISTMYLFREFMKSEITTSKEEEKPKSGLLNGPFCILGTTSKNIAYEDNSNHLYLIQAEGKNPKENDNKQKDEEGIKVVKHLLKDMQRLFDKTLEIKNPFQEKLLASYTINKPLKNYSHYLALIKVITYLHQHQLEIQTDANGVRYIETTWMHVEWADRICRGNV